MKVDKIRKAYFASRQIRRMRERSEKKLVQRLARARMCDAVESDTILDKEIRKRKTSPRPDYWNSVWGSMLRSDNVRDAGDRKGGKRFRRRFRVPFPIFEKIVAMVRSQNWFAECTDCTGRSGAPLELKILNVLRVVGRGTCFDGIEELNLISEETNRTFFHNFCELFSKTYFHEYCRPPQTQEEIASTMGVYEQMGLPGALGSTDCVHVRWEMCPAGEFSLHKGKEGYATLVYEVTVDHHRKIMAVTRGFPGTMNDKTVVRFDGFVTSIRDKKAYAEVTFELLDKNGIAHLQKGVYLIVDGGYHQWRCLQCPYKHATEASAVQWSEWVESVRKDVECTFGILKGRFRSLKLPIYFHNAEAIDNMFYTCCILHNMILASDGLDRRWEGNAHWLAEDGTHEANHVFNKFRRRVRSTIKVNADTDFARVGTDAFRADVVPVHMRGVEEIDSEHKVLKKQLIEHFRYVSSHPNPNVRPKWPT
jgi:hypothetical protein